MATSEHANLRHPGDAIIPIHPGVESKHLVIRACYRPHKVNHLCRAHLIKTFEKNKAVL